MSRSVSAPSSVTNTSPCWNGFIVPGSTFRYGSSFCMTTCRPRAVRRLPRLAAVRPLPSEETTPPVTKMCLVTTDPGLFTTGFQHMSRCGVRDATRGDSCAGELEQLLRVLQTGRRVGESRQQTRHLGHPLPRGDAGNAGCRDLPVPILLDYEALSPA